MGKTVLSLLSTHKMCLSEDFKLWPGVGFYDCTRFPPERLYLNFLELQKQQLLWDSWCSSTQLHTVKGSVRREGFSRDRHLKAVLNVRSWGKSKVGQESTIQLFESRWWVLGVRLQKWTMLKQSEIFGTRLNTKVKGNATDLVDVSCERTPQFPAQWLQQAQVEVARLFCTICVVRLECNL